jgi:uncharacterized membrane protein required for colicin V production
MGLDITLGVVVLLAGIRGWFKGFVRQAIPLSALVGCVYLADPIRELARPYAHEYFPSIGLVVLDRLLWWSSAVLAYLITTGVAFSILKSMKRKTYGEPEPNRTDQGAGFTFGVVKGLIIASFLAAAVRTYAPGYYPQAPFVESQAKTSKSLVWSEQYKPAESMWKSPPVRAFVGRVKSRGMWTDEVVPSEKAKEEAPKTESARPATPTEPLRTASEKPKTLSLPRLKPDSPTFERDFEEAMTTLTGEPAFLASSDAPSHWVRALPCWNSWVLERR